jgi:hypothetical protein
VQIEIQATPKDADVFLGDERLGRAPGPFRFQRGAGSIKLIIKAEAHSPEEVELTPDKDLVLSVRLNRLGPAKSTAGAGHKDLENPF